jgi:hypothetical protein
MSTQFSKRALTAGLGAGALALLAQTQRGSADTPFTTFPFAASGAPTPRTMPNRLADVVNARDYGVAGDASADDTTALQNAINAAFGVNGNGTSWWLNRPLYIPAGRYKISSALDLKNTKGGLIFGDGVDATRIFNVTLGGTVLRVNGLAHGRIRDLYLHAQTGGKAMDFYWDGVQSISSQMCQFENIVFEVTSGGVGCDVGTSGRDYQCDTSVWINCFFATGGSGDGMRVYGQQALTHNLYGGQFLNNNIGLHVQMGSVTGVFGTFFVLSQDWDFLVSGSGCTSMMVAGCSTESLKFGNIGIDATGATISSCIQRNGNAGSVFLEVKGFANVINCWSEAGVIRSGGADYAYLSVDNCKWGNPNAYPEWEGVFSPDIPLRSSAGSFTGKLVHYPLRARVFSELPAAPYRGMTAVITGGHNLTTPTFGATVAAGRQNVPIQIWYNGAAWKVTGV